MKKIKGWAVISCAGGLAYDKKTSCFVITTDKDTAKCLVFEPLETVEMVEIIIKKSRTTPTSRRMKGNDEKGC